MGVADSVRSQFMLKVLIVVLMPALSSWACAGTGTIASSNSAGIGVQSSQTAAGELHYKVPQGWLSEHPSSSMRAAQYKLPKAEDDREDASLVLYYFGAAQGGSVQANIDRWIGQMEQPDGGSSKDRAKIETLTVNGLKVTTVDLRGTYTAEMSPGSGTRNNSSNYRLRAAIVETPKGAYFAKLIGPEKTVSRWEQAFAAYVNSFEFK
jgi:hypothetical protein